MLFYEDRGRNPSTTEYGYISRYSDKYGDNFWHKMERVMKLHIFDRKRYMGSKDLILKIGINIT